MQPRRGAALLEVGQMQSRVLAPLVMSGTAVSGERGASSVVKGDTRMGARVRFAQFVPVTRPSRGTVCLAVLLMLFLVHAMLDSLEMAWPKAVVASSVKRVPTRTMVNVFHVLSTARPCRDLLASAVVIATQDT